MPPPPLPLLLVILLSLMPAFASQQAVRRPLKRLQSVTMGDGSSSSSSSSSSRAGGVADVFLQLMDSAGAPDPELERLLKVASGVQLDPAEMLKECASAEAIQVLLDEPVVMAKLLEEIPLLTVLPGFKSAASASSTVDMASGFKAGIDHLFGLLDAGQALDASTVAQAASKLLKSEDVAVQDLLSQAQNGSLAAHQGLRNLLHEDIMPGLNLQGFKDSIVNTHPSKLADVPEVMHYLDQDPFMSSMIRNFPHNPQVVLDIIGG